MARAQQPIVLQPPKLDPVPSPWGIAGQAGQQALQTFFQIFTQEKQLQLQREALEMEKEKEKQRQKKEEAQNQVGAGIAIQQAQSDPQTAQLLQGLAMPQQQLAQHVQQAPQGVQQALGNANQRLPSGNLGIPGVSRLPGQQPAFADNAALSAAVPMLQEQRQAGATLDLTRQQTAASKAGVEMDRGRLALEGRRTDAQINEANANIALRSFQLRLEERLAGLREGELRAQISRDQEAAAASRTQRLQSWIGMGNEIVAKYDRQWKDVYQASLAAGENPEQAQVRANLFAYGQPTKPDQKAFAENIGKTLQQMASQEAFDPQQLAEQFVSQPATEYAKRLGIQDDAIGHYNNILAVNQGDAQKTFDTLLREFDVQAAANNAPPAAVEAAKGALILYLQMLTGTTLQIKPAEKKQFWSSLFTMLGSQGSTGSPGVPGAIQQIQR